MPGDRVSDDREPGDRVPGDPVPGDRVPGDGVPGDGVSGDRVPGDPVPGDRKGRPYISCRSIGWGCSARLSRLLDNIQAQAASVIIP